MAVHKVDHKWLPVELHGKVWRNIEDTSALAMGDYVFYPANSEHYAGMITDVLEGGELFRVTCYKTVMSDTIADIKPSDNVFMDLLTVRKMYDLWWIDPCASDEEDD